MGVGLGGMGGGWLVVAEGGREEVKSEEICKKHTSVHVHTPIPVIIGQTIICMISTGCCLLN